MNAPHTEETLARLLRALPPAPTGWVDAAAQLPALRAQLDGLVARAEADATFRARALADLEAAARDAGLPPERRTLAALRARLEAEPPG